LQLIGERQRALEQLSDQMSTSGSCRVDFHPEGIRQFVKRRLSDLLALLNKDITKARAELLRHTREIRMIPEAAQDGSRYYVAVGGWDLLGGGLLKLVAGDGFEPPTFGL
jgi:hypothetical protein